MGMEHACGFERSQVYCDEGPPIGAVATQPWAEVALQQALSQRRENSKSA